MFSDRADAGRQLAERFRHHDLGDVVVLGVPRGGVPVAVPVARMLGVPLDVVVVRKLGVPGQPELAMGAIGESGVRIIDEDVVRAAGIDDAAIARVEAAEREELQRRLLLYRGDRPRVPLDGSTVLLVDDGIATGSTIIAASKVVRLMGAGRVVVAAPVASARSVQDLRDHADEVVVVEIPRRFRAVGDWYEDFGATPDSEVVALLEQFRTPRSAHSTEPGHTAPTEVDHDVEIPLTAARLGGRLSIPKSPRGFVVFVHGSGSSRHSPRNRAVAARLNHAGFGTLLFDLLTVSEEGDRAKVFDIPLLGGRLAEVTRWLRGQPGCESTPIGYFGASTGAGAALWAAADPASGVSAVVSRGGRPDLATDRLEAVNAATLLIVGGSDPRVLSLNRWAAEKLVCEQRLAVVPGAGHLFEEEGALDTVAELACEWFNLHLQGAAVEQRDG